MKDLSEEAMITVSIITPVHNGEKTIARTIESVLNQQQKPAEYIVVDGQSTDDSVKIAKSFENAFQEAGIDYVIMSEKDQGMYDALNKGISMASGELIGNINSDDWYEPNAIKIMTELYSRTQYDIAWSDIHIHNNGKVIRKRAGIGKLWTTNRFCHPSMFAKKSILMKYPYRIHILDADYDMILRANNDEVKIVTENVPISNFSMGGASTSKSISNMKYRIRMKYDTYRRNGYSRLYWFYCVIMEFIKYVLG